MNKPTVMDIKPWKTLQSDTAFEAGVFRIRKDVAQLPDGTIVQDHYVREQPDAAIVCCLSKDGQVVLVRQYRHGIGKVTTELPGGFMTRHDLNIKEAARRELLEETGYSSELMEEVAIFDADPNGATVQVHIFLARDAEKVSAPQFRPREQTETMLMAKEKLFELVADGTITAVAQVAAVHVLQEKLNA